ncbi:MAG: hypothetical protein QOH20_928, partial [Mycobacterium sp.]|nr:hypothetical protein [Mycobacterium sp.]
ASRFENIAQQVCIRPLAGDGLQLVVDEKTAENAFQPDPRPGLASSSASRDPVGGRPPVLLLPPAASEALRAHGSVDIPVHSGVADPDCVLVHDREG